MLEVDSSPGPVCYQFQKPLLFQNRPHPTPVGAADPFPAPRTQPLSQRQSLPAPLAACEAVSFPPQRRGRLGPIHPGGATRPDSEEASLRRPPEPGSGAQPAVPRLWEAEKHEFSVDMTCEGCAKAVSRVLDKLGGVKFDIDLPNKKVCIESEHSMDTLLETLKKTGKTVSYLGLE
ncbi:uncharacterized protein LOC103250960 [Carlito syrichta]|uniref:Copper transport protein ATOX1 n=1 Tax=Carlito syrichta TaxID=1868482 RepID=A0A3Q0DLY6_CARSF|nr:uncharacterized protein LOC103250960 [Carlito syrichta]